MKKCDFLQEFKKRDKAKSIVLVDHASKCPLDSSSKCKGDIYWLDGGLKQFKEKYPYLIVRDISTINHCRGACWKPTTPKPFFSKPIEIIDGLFIGDYQQASNKEVLLTYNIRYILNVAEECENVFKNDKRFVYCHVPLKDTTRQDLKAILLTCFQFIDQALDNDSCILVHCLAGRSRSAAIVVAYLVFRFKIGFKKACRIMEDKNVTLQINLGFIGQLMDIEKGV
ncbi:phosphatases II, partial [Rozella allomycis CSF55]